MRRMDRNQLKAEKLAEEFNKTHEIGETLTYVNDFGKEEKRVLRSKAWAASGNAIAGFEGFSGGYDITRIKDK